MFSIFHNVYEPVFYANTIPERWLGIVYMSFNFILNSLISSMYISW